MFDVKLDMNKILKRIETINEYEENDIETGDVDDEFVDYDDYE